MPKQHPYRATTLAAFAAVLAASSACGSSPTPGPSSAALALVVGAHANAASPTALPPVVQLLQQAADQQWQAAVIVDGGTPKVTAQGPLSVSSKNAFAQKQQKAQNVNRLIGAVRGSKVETEEVDLLGALTLAGRSLSSVKGDRTLVVIDSGLQTVAPLKFQEQGMLTADPTETADYLERTKALPQLTGVHVLFSGLGDTAAPQEPLTTAARDNLVALWTAVAERAGAKVDVLQTPLATDATVGRPHVTLVHAQDLQVPTQAPVPGAAPVAIELHESAVRFLPNKAVFKDPAAVAAVLAPVAAQMKTAGLHAHLTGATATAGTVDGRLRLSVQRAEAVKAALVAAGVPADRLTTSGVGSDWPRHVTDVAADGTLLPGPAAENRMVLIELSA